MHNDFRRVPSNGETFGGSYGINVDALATYPESGEDGFYRSGIGLSFLQHEDRGFVLLNIFLKHSVLVRAINASNVPGDDFDWVTDGLEGKNYISREYFPKYTMLEPRTTNL